MVIVNYNTGEYLTRCLASLAAHRGDVAMDVLVIDNASHDGSHLRGGGRPPVGAPDREPHERVPVAGVEPGHARDRRAVRAVPQPRRRMVAGTLADYVGGRPGASPRGHRGAAGPQPRRHGVPQRAGVPPLVDAVGHAFLGTVRPGQPLHAPLPAGRLGPHAPSATVDWVSGCCMLMPRAALDAVRRVRRGVPALRRGAGRGDAAARRGVVRAVHARRRGDPRDRRVHGTFAPHAAHALGQRLPLLPQAPRARRGGG